VPGAFCCGGVRGDLLLQRRVEGLGDLLPLLGASVCVERPEERGFEGRPEELGVIGTESLGVAAMALSLSVIPGIPLCILPEPQQFNWRFHYPSCLEVLLTTSSSSMRLGTWWIRPSCDLSLTEARPSSSTVP
jgi:hypothetical protein